MAKIRLDKLLTQKGLVESRNKAQALIMAGKVRVDGQVISKIGTPVSLEATIEVVADLPYVSRGGAKLVAAVEAFDLDFTGMICADVGASTGGFTDVLLQHGAKRVYAIDVGYGQLAWKLRQDERVVVMERTNARHLRTLPQLIEFVTIDASFISLRLVLPVVQKWLSSPAFMVALVKPQFEAGKSEVGKGGVVKDRAVHQQVLENIITYSTKIGFDFLGLIASPLTGPAGNHEFLLYLGWKVTVSSDISLEKIEQCLLELDTL
jgi:23S rRNA (cytidine1920-2'-O)/16S rRNA (cytidine1409-2'-O)-methyltransferase